MDVKTFEGFVDFVASQEPNKQIVHSIWGKCAVGEYVNGCSSDNGVEHCKALEFAKNVLPTDVWEMLWKERPKTYNDLDNRLKMMGYFNE